MSRVITKEINIECRTRNKTERGYIGDENSKGG